MTVSYAGEIPVASNLTYAGNIYSKIYLTPTIYPVGGADRITESSDLRITEDGNTRITE